MSEIDIDNKIIQEKKEENESIMQKVFEESTWISMWFEKNRFMVIVFVMLIIWGSILIFLAIKTEEITKDPCSICSKRLGADIICYQTKGISERRRYYENGSIEDFAPLNSLYTNG